MGAGLVVGAVVAANLSGALVGVFFDDGIYLSLARSLAEGHGYRLLYLPGAPGAVHYPFLYPLFLSALWKVVPAFPANVPVFKAANAVLLGLSAALLVLYLHGRMAWPAWRLALVVVVAATAVPLVTVATVLFAEPLFLVFLIAACWAGEAARTCEGREGAWRRAAVAGVLAAAAALTRSLGITVVVAVPVALALARRPRAALVAAAASGLCLAPWLWWVARHRADVDPALLSGYGTYGDLLAQAGWAPSAGALLRPMGAVALAPFHGWLRFFFGVPALGLLVAGAGVLLRKASVLGWVLVLYGAVIVIWPYGPDRFVWAAWPFLAVAFVAGAEQVAARARTAAPALRALAPWAVLAVVAAVAGGYGYYQVRGYGRGDVTRLERGISASFADLLPWVRETTPPSAVVAGEDEALLWLYTGRRAVPSYVWRYRGRSDESLGPDTLKAWLDRAGVSYVLLSGSGSDAAPTISQLLGRYPGYLHVARMWGPAGGAMAFAVDRSGTSGAPGGAAR